MSRTLYKLDLIESGNNAKNIIKLLKSRDLK